MKMPMNPGSTCISLGYEAHHQAEQFSQQHRDWQKAEQVYFNTLAIYAVNHYLQRLGFATDLTASSSCDRVAQTLADVADLMVIDYGSLECRWVLPDQETVQIPPEVWHDRIGYIAVLLHETLEEAELLGFIDRAETTEIPLEQFRPLEGLANYLASLHQPAALVQLGQWLEGTFTAGWDSIATILTHRQPELAFSFRQGRISRGKRIELTQAQRSIAMIVSLDAIEAEVEIQVEVVPADSHPFLPTDLQLTVLDESGKSVMNTQTTDDNQKVRLQFSGEVGDRFSIQIKLEEMSVVEEFVI